MARIDPAKNFNKYDRDKNGAIDPSRASFKPGQLVETHYSNHYPLSKELSKISTLMAIFTLHWHVPRYEVRPGINKPTSICILI